VIIGDWAAKNGIRKVATLTTDYAPGNDALQFFKARFLAGGGEVVDEFKVPLVNPDFAPFLQRIKDAKPDALYVFVPGGQGGNFMKQFAERGLGTAGIRIIGPGDVMDDDLLNNMGDAALGTVTAHMSERQRAPGTPVHRSRTPGAPPRGGALTSRAKIHAGESLPAGSVILPGCPVRIDGAWIDSWTLKDM
jgi:ABC-type branched-subunit amino acid transport system substrate-binding protein